MSISIACPVCGTKATTADDMAGKTANCPACAAAVPVPFEVVPVDAIPAGPSLEPRRFEDSASTMKRAVPADGIPDVPVLVVQEFDDRPERDGGSRRTIPSTPDERNLAMLCHLLGIFTGFIGPLILWLVKKDESRFIDYHGKEALNFALNVLVYVFGTFAVVFIAALVTCGFGAVLFPLVAAPAIYGIVMKVIASIEASKGELYQYPGIVRIIT